MIIYKKLSNSTLIRIEMKVVALKLGKKILQWFCLHIIYLYLLNNYNNLFIVEFTNPRLITDHSHVSDSILAVIGKTQYMTIN